MGWNFKSVICTTIDSILRHERSNADQQDEMRNVGQHNVHRPVVGPIPTVSTCLPYNSETRVDMALLACALFLQRFSFKDLGIPFDMVAAVLILLHQFGSGRLVIQYDRLLWFLLLGLAATSSLLFNFRSTMLASYGVLLVMYFLFTLRRPSTRDKYRSTLHGFQFLVLILVCLGIVQFVAQLLIDGRQIILFFGLVPDFLLAPIATWGQDAQVGSNTIIPLTHESSLIKSNGIFLAEPSTLSELAALAIIVEVLEFRRPWYLFLLALGLLLSYSGTGVTILLLLLPFSGLFNTRAQLPAMLVSLLVFALFVTGIIDLSVYTSRVGEFEDVNGSAFMRFISSFWMAGEHFDSTSLTALLRGNGPATMKEFVPRALYSPFGDTWFKVIYEYGLIGAFVFTCFLLSCLRRSRCPTLVILALFYIYLFTGNGLISTPLLTTMIVLSTLSGPEHGNDTKAEISHYRSSLVPRSSAG
jgi:hypothetical protein